MMMIEQHYHCLFGNLTLFHNGTHALHIRVAQTQKLLLCLCLCLRLRFVRSFINSSYYTHSLTHSFSPNNGESVVKLLVGNKIDMERQIDRERAESWARDHGMLFLEASAKTRLGIKQVFMEVVQKILDNPEALATAVPGKPKLQIKRPVEAPEDEDEGGCC